MAAATPGVARDITAAEDEALRQRIADFDTAMREGDMQAVMGVVPPGIYRHIAEQAGLSVDEVRAQLVTVMEAVLDEVRIVAFSMDYDAAERRELRDGTPYVLVPTTTVIEVEGQGTLEQQSHTVALLDDGRWYLVRMSDPQQLAVMRAVYPDFVGVELPQGSMKIVDPER